MDNEFWEEQLRDKANMEQLYPSEGAKRFSRIVMVLLSAIVVVALIGCLFRVAWWAIFGG